MDEKRYSLNDIFGILNESFAFLDYNVECCHEVDEKTVDTPMKLGEFIAMMVATELTSNYSRLACPSFTAPKKVVIEAMKANYFKPVAFPNYESAGVNMTPLPQYSSIPKTSLKNGK